MKKGKRHKAAEDIFKKLTEEEQITYLNYLRVLVSMQAHEPEHQEGGK